jgi:hypothetical protein
MSKRLIAVGKIIGGRVVIITPPTPQPTSK